MKDKAYRDAYVQSQIRTALPFQLRALRMGKGWSQETAAERAGMAQPRISELERPSGRMPNLDTLCRIASAHDVALEVRFVPFSELIDRSENFDPENFYISTFEEEISAVQEAQEQGQHAASYRSGGYIAEREFNSLVASDINYKSMGHDPLSKIIQFPANGTNLYQSRRVS